MHNYVTAIGFMDVYDTPYMDKICLLYTSDAADE